eukprot:TRINITY_DN976_c0_g1_i3.p1 TRINITY_DN976_c0_g1~~TRINITY_DN976_c0_g1_i3.p1  ORF type:complete len:186 (+),score=63.36 TRINITY_DN976_c0_g1_i3:502-1059(+)
MQVSITVNYLNNDENKALEKEWLFSLFETFFLTNSSINNYLPRIQKQLQTKEGRTVFWKTLNDLRVNSCLQRTAFYVLCSLMFIALEEANKQEDYSSACRLLHMASTYYRLRGGVREFIQNRLMGLEIWTISRFWEEAFYDALLSEKEKQQPKHWPHLTQEEQDAQIEIHSQLAFGLLGTFGKLV